MIGPFLRDAGGDRLALEAIPFWLAGAMQEIPGLLDPKGQPDDVEERLFPHPGDEEELREEWRHLVVPELHHLVSSSREVVGQDLQGLEPPARGEELWRIEFPAKHLNAWIHALHAARLTLGARHRIRDEDELEASGVPMHGDRGLAITKIHVLGTLEEILIEQASPPPDEDDGGETAD